MKQTFKQHLIFNAFGYSVLNFHAFYDWDGERWVHNPENLHTDEGVFFDDLNIVDRTAVTIAADKLAELLDEPEEEERAPVDEDLEFYAGCVIAMGNDKPRYDGQKLAQIFREMEEKNGGKK